MIVILSEATGRIFICLARQILQIKDNTTMCNRKKLIIIAGPTAVGKTALSVELAKRIGGEVISADSMQVYRGMDIGTAKITPGEMQGVRHHLIDILSPFEPWSVHEFKKRACEAMEGIYERGNVPIICGGTGFYIQAVLYDIDFTEEEPSKVREELNGFLAGNGAQALYERLKSVDPEGAAAIHQNNVKRVMRALEYHMTTGEKMSEHNLEQSQKKSPYDFTYIVLNTDRERVYERIDRRVDMMMEAGLLDEVKALKAQGLDSSYVSMKGLGYKEILGYLDGEYDLDEAVRILKRDTRHFAKRQVTWFKREKDTVWLDPFDEKYKDEGLTKYILHNII